MKGLVRLLLAIITPLAVLAVCFIIFRFPEVAKFYTNDTKERIISIGIACIGSGYWIRAFLVERGNVWDRLEWLILAIITPITALAVCFIFFRFSEVAKFYTDNSQEMKISVGLAGIILGGWIQNFRIERRKIRERKVEAKKAAKKAKKEALAAEGEE